MRISNLSIKKGLKTFSCTVLLRSTLLLFLNIVWTFYVFPWEFSSFLLSLYPFQPFIFLLGTVAAFLLIQDSDRKWWRAMLIILGITFLVAGVGALGYLDSKVV